MKKIFIVFILFLVFDFNFSFAGNVCCEQICYSSAPFLTPVGERSYMLIPQEECKSGFSSCDRRVVDMSKCQTSTGGSTGSTGGSEASVPGKVNVGWQKKQISVCPPGIFGTGPCTYPSLVDLIKRINELLRNVAPPLLVILLILGGLMYLLTPLNVEEYIKSGHRYIKYAVIGYILLLIVTLIFTIISALFGGPST